MSWVILHQTSPPFQVKLEEKVGPRPLHISGRLVYGKINQLSGEKRASCRYDFQFVERGHMMNIHFLFLNPHIMARS